MEEDKPRIVVTGISGDLGLRLLPKLKEYRVTGIDLKPPETNLSLQFVQMDLGLEDACRELFLLMRELRPVAVIHLAFAAESANSETSDADRRWQINVGGTARVLEAITEVNRDAEIIKKFIFLSCVFAYGPDLSEPVTEDHKLEAHTLEIAIHKMESDQAIQQRAPSARGCSVYVLRSANFAGAKTSNYWVGTFRGTPNSRSKLGAKLAGTGKRLPCVLPWGKRSAQNRVQFVHVDDIARLIQFILRKTEPEARRLTILNVAGRGEPLTSQRCQEIADAKVMRVPGKWARRQLLRWQHQFGLSSIPPEAGIYLSGNAVMDTSRLREFLGAYFEEVIQFTATDAFSDCFASPLREEQHSSATV
jgi:nucleoside-diphosphate-sugar epimerase